MRDLLPKEILRRPKVGFRVPLRDWFRVEMKDMVYDILLSQRIRERGYFNTKTIAALVNSHMDGSQDNARLLFPLLCFEMWCRIFIDRNKDTFQK